MRNLQALHGLVLHAFSPGLHVYPIISLTLPVEEFALTVDCCASNNTNILDVVS